MAITQTGAIYKALTFDNTSSRNYGVYITGQAVYNAPQRDVEMISIPGRNGAFALDKGRFENIEVTYPAGIFADTEADFAQAVSNFRNFLCSRNGYVRLTDEYNPNEYRMAIYKSGLEVSPAQLKAGEFEIIFDCKPQRWLTSGETAVTVANNGTLTNPTLFDSSPLLEVKGYGEIEVGTGKIKINNVPLGKIPITYAVDVNDISVGNFSYVVQIDNSELNNHDVIYISGIECVVTYDKSFGYTGLSCSVSSTSDATGSCDATGETKRVRLNDVSTLYGEVAHLVGSVDFTQNYNSGGTTHTNSVRVTLSVDYDGNNTITVTVSDGATNPFATTTTKVIKIPIQFAVSSKSGLGSPSYIDLDIGEAWKLSAFNEEVSLNNSVQLPAKLPVLSSGSNVITYDNTITELKVRPRWWKV